MHFHIALQAKDTQDSVRKPIQLAGYYAWRNTALVVSRAIEVEHSVLDETEVFECEQETCKSTFYRM